MQLSIPYVAQDNNDECGLACALMVAQYFLPKENISIEDIKKIIKYKEGTWTFPLQQAIVLNHLGIEATCFSNNPEDYTSAEEDPNIFIKAFGSHWPDIEEHVDIESYNYMCKLGKANHLYTCREHKFNQMIDMLEKGSVCIFPLDWFRLHDEKKDSSYQGHVVVLAGYEDGEVLLHDPLVGPYTRHTVEQVEFAYSHPVIANDLVIAHQDNELLPLTTQLQPF